MDPKQQNSPVKETFNMVAGGYDGQALRFFPASAAHMANSLELRGDEHVLDVATGTGHAALAIAGMLPRGKVTAVDFSAGMLEQARIKADIAKVRNIDFIEGDMQDLQFPDDTFDIAVCAFGIFFVENMAAQLANIASKVKPGGRVMISSFQESYFHPLRKMLLDRLLAHGVQQPPPIWRQIAGRKQCQHLFEQAGLTSIRVEGKNLGYYLTSAGEWWDVVWNAGFRRMISQLVSSAQEQFKREHLAEVEAAGAEDGIWLDIGVLYTSGIKPERE